MKTLAVDFGTTTTLVSRYVGGHASIHQVFGKRATPSVFRYENVNGSTTVVAVGEKALREVFQYPETTVWEFKPFLGDDSVKFGSMTAYQAGFFFLEKLRDQLEDQQGGIKLAEEYERTKVGFPADWSPSNQRKMIQLFNDAGFPNVEGCSEPVAITNYVLSKELVSLKNGEVFCVVDLGGGTLDVALMEREKGGNRCIMADGDSSLGGRHFDEALVKYTASKMGADPASLSSVDLAVIAQGCKTVKEDLSTCESTSAMLFPLSFKPEGYSLEISRKELESCCKEQLDRIKVVIDDIIKASGVLKDRIGHVIIAGGASKMPSVRKAVQDCFSSTKARFVPVPNPEECVCEGLLLGNQVQKQSIHKKRIIAGAALLAVAVAGALLISKHQPKKSFSAEELIPLSVGNKWVYRTYKGSNRNHFSESISFVKSQSVIAGKVWYEHTELGDTFYSRNDKHGHYNAEVREKNGKVVILNSDLVYKYPVKLTPQWYKDSYNNKIKVAQRNIDVFTPAGKFKCLLYIISSDGYTCKNYISPGVGLIKSIRIHRNDRTTDELVSYTLNQQAVNHSDLKNEYENHPGQEFRAVSEKLLEPQAGEEKINYPLHLAEGNRYLAAENWKAAEQAFNKALGVTGYGSDPAALDGLRRAQGGDEMANKNKVAQEVFARVIRNANSAFSTAKGSGLSDSRRRAKCQEALEELADLESTFKNDQLGVSKVKPVDYLTSSQKSEWLTLKNDVQAYMKRFGPSEGSAHRSSATGMEFVWIDALEIWVGKYEVTNEEYRKYKSGHDSGELLRRTLNGPRQPVVDVNFDDAKAYAQWLTEKELASRTLPAGYGYRLPTEDEWMTFAQCGRGWKYPWGNNWPPRSWQAGNYDDETKYTGSRVGGNYRDGHAVSCDVEDSWANPWGLYGVGGNVWEMAAKDKSNSSFGAWRGASWNCCLGLRCSYRFSFFGGWTRDNNSGFRLVLSPEGR